MAKVEIGVCEASMNDSEMGENDFGMFHVLCLAQGVNLGFASTPTIPLMASHSGIS